MLALEKDKILTLDCVRAYTSILPFTQYQS